MKTFDIYPFEPPSGTAALRREIRAFVAENRPFEDAARRTNCWAVQDPVFSRKLGLAGYVGMTWPKKYGGHDRHPLARYVVIEELLALGAPIGAHWIADRQTGPLILRYGSEEQRQRYLPGMARGEIYSCIGLSEPGAGSDLANIRTSGVRVPGGWLINGQKIWTTNAHYASVMLTVVRTRGGSQRQEGLSQFLIDLDRPGVSVRPIIDLVGHHEFNEVFLEDVNLPDEALMGTEGGGWKQLTAELAFERSGPERYLSSYPLIVALIDAMGKNPSPAMTRLIGELTADLWTLRQMSMSVAAKLVAGEDPMLNAAIFKDLGNMFEQSIPVAIQAALGEDIDLADNGDLPRMLAMLLQTSPSFSLRGGTREVMRGIIARGLGLR